MSFIPPQSPSEREAIHERENEMEVRASEYARLHPEAEYPAEHRPGVLGRLVEMMRGKHTPRSGG